MHPEIESDCLRIAALFSRSTNLSAARWGSHRILKAQTDPALRGEALQQFRDRSWWAQQAWSVGMNQHTSDHGWDPWTNAEWLNWANTSAVGDGEIPSVKRWLASRGMSVSAPPDADLPIW